MDQELNTWPAFRQGLLLGVLVFAVLAVTHRSLLFGQPWHEHSDYAINAMQIEKAGHLRAIHGNASRFGFHHPGPAFFYVSAAGEWLFRDVLRVAPSRFNAHVLAGLALQSFFFAAALVMANRWVRRPLFIPLALVLAAAHFRMAGNAFISIWPPYELLMPFLCFLVGAASVAAGCVCHLPVTVLAGCFLVHGHVAQPLFVLPLFLCAYGLLWLRARRAPGGGAEWFRGSKTKHLVSVGIVLLFLVPFAIDLAAGADSNLAQIVEFERFYRGHGKSLWKSLLYLGGFFSYLHQPEVFLPEHLPGRADFIAERIGFYVAWVGIVATVLASVIRMAPPHAAPERPFLVALVTFLSATVLLTLYWGVAQVGGMYEYNGHFIYATLFGILLLFAAACARTALPRHRLVGAGLCLGAVALTWPVQYAPSPFDYSTNTIPAAVDAALRSDPSPAAPKYLLFDHRNWGEAASMALALQRAGHSYRVNADWGPKFASDAGFEPAPPTFDLSGFSVWRVSYLGPHNEGRRFRDNLRLYFSPLPLDPAGGIIDCRPEGNLELYALFGLATPVDAGVWSISPGAGLIFHSPPVPTDVVLTITAAPFVQPGLRSAQAMTLHVNGHDIRSFRLTVRDTVTTRIPAAVWNARQDVLLVLHFPDAVTPAERGLRSDARTLGWEIEQIRFALSP